jgi:hypothetical protein
LNREVARFLDEMLRLMRHEFFARTLTPIIHPHESTLT